MIFVKIKAESRLIVKVSSLLNIKGLGSISIKLLRNSISRRVKLFEKTGRNGQKVDTGKLLDFTRITERCAHDNCLIAKLLVVVEDALNRVDTRILRSLVRRLSSRSLVPIQDATNKGRNKSGTGFSSGNSLNERKEKSQVNVDSVLGFKLTSSLNTFIGRSNLNKDTFLRNPLLLIKIDNFESLFNGTFLVERKTGINLSRNTARDDFENLGTKLNEQVVKGLLSLLGGGSRGLGSSSNSIINKLCVLSFFGSSQNE